MKNLNIFVFDSFFLRLTSLEKRRQEVSGNISLSLTIINSKVVLQEFLGPINLPRTQAFCIHELFKVIIVSKNKKLIFAVFWVVVPHFKNRNNGWELLIVRFVSSFSEDHQLKEKSYKVPLAKYILREIRMMFVDHLIAKTLIWT